MAIGKCRECGKKVSSEAATCPNCGSAKPYKKSLGTGSKIVIVFVLFMGFVMYVGEKGLQRDRETAAQEAAKSPEQIAAEKAASVAREARFQKVVRAGKAIKKSLNEPDSLVWESIMANADASVICMEYRARNGFGGINREFAAIHKNRASQDASSWNTHCAGKTLFDMKYARHGI